MSTHAISQRIRILAVSQETTPSDPGQRIWVSAERDLGSITILTRLPFAACSVQERSPASSRKNRGPPGILFSLTSRSRMQASTKQIYLSCSECRCSGFFFEQAQTDIAVKIWGIMLDREPALTQTSPHRGLSPPPVRAYISRCPLR